MANKGEDWTSLLKDAARLLLREVARGTGKEIVDSVRRTLKDRRERKKELEEEGEKKDE